MEYCIFLAKKYPWLVFTNFFAVIAACTLVTGNNYVFKKIIDSVGNFDQLWFWTVSFALVFLLSAVCWRISGFMGMNWMVRISSDSYNNLFHYLTKHSTSFFDNRFAGSLSSKVSNASEGVRRMCAIFVWNLFPVLINVGVSLILAWSVDGAFALIMIIWAIIFISFNYFGVRYKQKFSIEFASDLSSLRGQMVDITTNIKAVHQYSRRPHEMERLTEFIDKKQNSHIKNWTLGEIMLIVNNLLQFSFVLIMVGTAVWFNQYRGLEVGSTIMIITLSNLLKDQLMWIGNHFNELMDFYGEVSDGLQEILASHDLIDIENAKPLLIKKAEIDFKNVYFNYGEKSVFRNFNLKIQPGQKIGLVGESGAGKSTLVSIILRQHDLMKGEILIDGQNINQVMQESLRENISVVPQEPLLFHRDILENIRYGNLRASEDDIIAASKSAQAHQFVMDLPQAYQTMVGERGVKLSGGQRQRIAIARAILKNAPILILDEATSSLDSQSEAEIQKALKNLMKDKTVIAVAHRLSTIKSLDRIIVIDKGQIVQDGSHDELLKEDTGVYKELWHRQVEGFI